LIYGRSIATWRSEHNIPDVVALPAICSEIKCAVDGIKENFMIDPDNLLYIITTKIKQHHRGKPWENTAFSLWLQTLEAKCMVEALAWLNNIGVPASSLIHDGALIKASDQPRVEAAVLFQDQEPRSGGPRSHVDGRRSRSP